MEVRKETAFEAGVLGAVVLSLTLGLSRLAGWTTFSFELLWGTPVTGSVDFVAGWVGFLIHLCVGGLLGLAYRAGFKAVRRVNWDTGVAFGVLHWLIAGLTLGSLSSMNPQIPRLLPEPGSFGLLLGGGTFLAILIGHLAFGATVGAYCAERTRRELLKKQVRPILRRVA